MVVIQLKIWQLHIGEELVWSVALKAHDPGLTSIRKHSYFSAILTLVEIKNTAVTNMTKQRMSEKTLISYATTYIFRSDR